MDVYRNKEAEDSGCNINVDMWEPYQGTYPEPTYEEYNLISRFLYKFTLEDDDFVEDQYKSWIYFKKHLGFPNLRSLLIKFLAQVRGTKGYDVDTYFDFSVVSTWKRYNVFVPLSLDDQRFYRQAMAASKFAIHKINALTGKNYEVVSVEKLVSTTTNMLLLTFTAKEIATADLEYFQAMVYAKYFHVDVDADADASSATTFQLKDWKFKPIPFEQL